MENNVTFLDAVIRFCLVLVLGILAVYFDTVVLLIAAMLLAVTAITMTCPLYHFLGINKKGRI